MWIRICEDPNFLWDLDPELEIMDPDPAMDPELDWNLVKNHLKI
jgi:hypothetical protein